jgi:hypothetical protein
MEAVAEAGGVRSSRGRCESAGVSNWKTGSGRAGPRAVGVILVLLAAVLELQECWKLSLEPVRVEAVLLVVTVLDFGGPLDDSSCWFESIYSKAPLSDLH